MTGWFCNTLSDRHERVDGRLWPIRQKTMLLKTAASHTYRDLAQLSLSVLTKPRKTDHPTQTATLLSP